MNQSIIRWTGMCVLLLTTLVVKAQEASFIPPFDFPMLFSGNFGEIRANHFHGGLDFKTGGVSGKPVRAMADGYLARIQVTHGSGYVLHVVYDNGYTAINRHLSAFVGEVARRVEDLQYERESWEVEIVPQPHEYRVKRGEVIARSGNTGYSFGPHLHLDLIETATGEHVDPLPFLARGVHDEVAPKALGWMLFPQPGRGVVNGRQERVALPLQPREPVTAWGWMGAGIRAYDHMNGAANRYGVHTVILEVDGREVFRSVVDRFAPAENRYINSWTEGEYMKSFVEPGNRLRMLHVPAGETGLWCIDEERPYHLVYTLRDALGNTSKVRLTVHGKRQPIEPLNHRPKYVWRWNRTNFLQEPGLDMLVPKGMLYRDVYLQPKLSVDSGAVALTYAMHSEPVPLHGYCDLRIGLRSYPVADSTKYYVAGVSRKGKRFSVGGRMENGRMRARVRELGTYTVAVDTVPPVLTPLNPKQWGQKGRIVLRAKDAETGIAHYRGTIDGAYALFGKPNAVDGLLVCELDPQRVERGRRHVLELQVTDGCGNVTTNFFGFYY